MAKTKGTTSLIDRKLSDVVEISRQFLRSVRIDADVGREDALSGYVCQGTARSLLESMGRQIVETRQRAFTWTGPYGGGKSSLALMLCSLVGPPKIRSRAKTILGFPDNSPVFRAFDAKGEGWLVLPVVGKRGSVIQELSSALARAQGIAAPRRKAPDVIGELVAAADKHSQGVLVVIDELGKFLEASAQEGDDIYFFQELAEAASRCAGKLVVVGVLHQAFEAYAARLGRQAREDWAKVQGRFVDIPLVSATDEVIELIGRAVTVTDGPDIREASKLAERIASAVRARRPGTPHGLQESLKACWPLHPVTAALLGPISKRRFGQNERSTFGFLASREPLGFVEFLNGYDALWNSMYGPARYWDYLRANLEPAILASPDGHRWAISSEAVERAEAKGQEIHVLLTKTVALIEMFRNGSGLVADEQVLGVSIPKATDVEIRKALGELADWKVLIERKHLGAWGVYAGSDFDIEGAVNAARGELGQQPDFERISALSDLQPVLAKRLYQTTGTMRWFVRRIVRLSDIERDVSKFQVSSGAVGAFLMCLPDVGQPIKSVEHKLRKVTAEFARKTVLLGTPKNAERIAELSLELAAAERVMNTRTELHGDSVARRELVGRIEAVRGSLEEELADAFGLARWYHVGELLDKEHGRTLPAIASSLAGSVFDQTPHVFSELINREEPSSNSVKARKDLMYRMVSHGHLAKLGYEGFPADAGLYFTVLHEPGLHRERKKEWAFGEPNQSARGQSMESLWWRTKNEILEASKVTTLSQLYDFWRSAPFGLRAGLMPVLSLAFFLAHRSSLALYVDGVFTPDVSEATVDEWTLDPGRIRFQHVEASEDQAKYVGAIAKSMASHTQSAVGDQPLDAARGLVAMVMGLPGWTKRTATVSALAQDVRAMLLKANDPHKVLFADLPTLFQAKKTEELVAKLSTIVRELNAAYDKMLDDVRARLLEALDHTGRDLPSLRVRAGTVKGITGDFRLDAFAGRLELYDASVESIESLISLAVSKPAANWVDRDIDAAVVQLATWAIEFRKTETMAPLRGRPSTRRVIGVVFGASHGMDASGSVDIAESDIASVDRLVKSILAKAQGERPEVILAALAEAGALMVNQRKQEAV